MPDRRRVLPRSGSLSTALSTVGSGKPAGVVQNARSDVPRSRWGPAREGGSLLRHSSGRLAVRSPLTPQVREDRVGVGTERPAGVADLARGPGEARQQPGHPDPVDLDDRLPGRDVRDRRAGRPSNTRARSRHAPPRRRRGRPRTGRAPTQSRDDLVQLRPVLDPALERREAGVVADAEQLHDARRRSTRPTWRSRSSARRRTGRCRGARCTGSRCRAAAAGSRGARSRSAARPSAAASSRAG